MNTHQKRTSPSTSRVRHLDSIIPFISAREPHRKLQAHQYVDSRPRITRDHDPKGDGLEHRDIIRHNPLASPPAQHPNGNCIPRMNGRSTRTACQRPRVKGIVRVSAKPHNVLYLIVLATVQAVKAVTIG